MPKEETKKNHQGEGGGPKPTWTPEAKEKAFLKICEALASEISVGAICEADENLPSRAEFYQWMARDEKLQDIYARAKANQIEFLLDQVPEIADDGENDYQTIKNKDGTEYEKVNYENIQRSRLRVDSRIKLAEKLSAKKYGTSRTELSGPKGAPISFEGFRVEIVRANPNVS